MPINLNHLSAKELAAVINQAQKRQTVLKKRKPAAGVRSKLIAMAKAAGYTIEELFGSAVATRKAAAPKAAKKPARKTAKRTAAKKIAGKKPARKSTKGRKLGKVAPKYRNPANPKETWAGRGKQPRWMAELIKRGKTAADFLISAAPTPKPIKPGKRVVKKTNA